MTDQPAESPAAETPAAPAAEPEHRASWLELFFDLVVVVAIATLTARLAVLADGAALARVLIMYLAIWLVWTSFMLYANIAGDSTHRRALLMAMGCIAVMAAAVPAADDFRRGQVFAVAYVVARLIASRTWQTTASVLVDWPIAQLSFGLLPWVASLWFETPVRYFLWGAGMILDIVFAIGLADDPQALLQRVQKDYDRARRQRGPKRAVATSGTSRRQRSTGKSQSNRQRPDDDPVTYQAVDVDQGHFGERLGVFTIIVLGESVTQVVTAASAVEWTWRLDVAAATAFLFLFGLWWLTFQYSAYTEQESADALPTHLALPLHFLTTAAIMLMAAGLGEIVAEPEHPLGTGLRWILGGGLAGYLLASQAALALTRWSRPWWLTSAGITVGAAPLVLAGFGSHIPGWLLAAALALVVGAQVLFRKADAHLDRTAGNGGTS